MNATRLLKAIFICCFLSSTILNAQDITYNWDSYKTKFKIPTDFVVSQSDGYNFIAGNSDINLSIFPKKDENLSYRQMKSYLLDWANRNVVVNLTETTSLNNLNGYWGVFVEGTKDNFPVTLLLLVDPDFPEYSLYVWISYRAEKVDRALDILYSFEPN